MNTILRTFTYNLLWAFSFLFLMGCEDPVELKLPKNVRFLAVQGLITDQPGPYTVTLSMTAPYGRPTGLPDTELEGAQVTITNDKGQQEVLQQHGLGIFKTSVNGIRGRVGGVYTLTIRLRNGQTYQSSAEVLAPSAELADLHLNFKKEPVFEGGIEPVANLQYELSVDVEDPADRKDYYRWEWEGVYEVSAQPWDHLYWPPMGNGPIPDPKRCCKTCWVYDTTNIMEVAEDRLFNGNRFRKLVGVIPLNEFTINVRYRVEVLQYSLSAEAYDYWRVFIAQTRNVGSVLDPPPANSKGNIRNMADPDEPVIGYFGASAVTRKAIFIDRAEVPEVPPMLKYPDDCRVIDFSTVIRPLFW